LRDTNTAKKTDDPDCDFVNTCRELGIDEDSAAFDRMLKKITKALPPVTR
jgi:hypothetical protein